jgi:hypothetical protein
MPAVDGPVSPALLDVAALDSIEAHEQDRLCCGDCTGTPECDQLQWALRRTEEQDLAD